MSYSLPQSIREALENKILAEFSLSGLKEAADGVSLRYRRVAGGGQQNLQIQSQIEAYAYVAARLPATYAANLRVMEEIGRRLKGFEPRTMLDIGAGPGTASLAARQTWASLSHQVLVEPNRYLQEVGQDLGIGTNWVAQNFQTYAPTNDQKNDLIVLSYVLNEINGDYLSRIGTLWKNCSGVMVILEPGTPAGADVIRIIREWARQRDDLFILGPCPHQGACPLNGGERWCHFSVRTNRSKLHKALKGGDAGFEDEKFSYLVLSKGDIQRPDYRLIGHPSGDKVRELQVCGKQGAETLRLSKSHRLYKATKKCEWGDGINDQD